MCIDDEGPISPSFRGLACLSFSLSGATSWECSACVIAAEQADVWDGAHRSNTDPYVCARSAPSSPPKPAGPKEGAEHAVRPQTGLTPKIADMVTRFEPPSNLPRPSSAGRSQPTGQEPLQTLCRLECHCRCSPTAEEQIDTAEAHPHRAPSASEYRRQSSGFITAVSYDPDYPDHAAGVLREGSFTFSAEAAKQASSSSSEQTPQHSPEPPGLQSHPIAPSQSSQTSMEAPPELSFEDRVVARAEKGAKGRPDGAQGRGMLPGKGPAQGLLSNPSWQISAYGSDPQVLGVQDIALTPRCMCMCVQAAAARLSQLHEAKGQAWQPCMCVELR